MSPVEASQGKPREGKAVLGPQRRVRQALEVDRRGMQICCVRIECQVTAL
jgi:hypothetical protein